MSTAVQTTGMNKVLMIVTFILMCLGTAVVYTATQLTPGHATPEDYLMSHLGKVVIGIGVMIFCAKFDYGAWKLLGRWVFVGGLILTVAALVIGKEVNGAHRWIFGIQPSEILKAGFIMWICAKLSDAGDEVKTLKCTVIQPAIPFLIAAVVLALQPNYSMLVMFVVILATVLCVAGANLKYMGIGALVMFPLIAIKLLTSSHSWSRIMTFFDPSKMSTDARMQSERALEALGNGGFFGTGFGNGLQKLGYLPEAHKDVVYTVIGEEFGFIGTFGVLLAFALIFSQGFNIARNSTTRFGKFLAVALTTSLFMNFCVHVCVCVRLFPVTGQPLPFLSYGGTNLIESAAFVGILLNISCSTTGKKIKEPYMSNSKSLGTGVFRNYGRSGL